MLSKDAVEMVNIVDPDQTAPSGMIWGLHCLFRSFCFNIKIFYGVVV